MAGPQVTCWWIVSGCHRHHLKQLLLPPTDTGRGSTAMTVGFGASLMRLSLWLRLWLQQERTCKWLTGGKAPLEWRQSTKVYTCYIPPRDGVFPPWMFRNQDKRVSLDLPASELTRQSYECRIQVLNQGPRIFSSHYMAQTQSSNLRVVEIQWKVRNLITLRHFCRPRTKSPRD